MQRKRDYLASLEKESGLFKKLTEDLEADLRLNFSRKKILNKELQVRRCFGVIERLMMLLCRK